MAKQNPTRLIENKEIDLSGGGYNSTPLSLNLFLIFGLAYILGCTSANNIKATLRNVGLSWLVQEKVLKVTEKKGHARGRTTHGRVSTVKKLDFVMCFLFGLLLSMDHVRVREACWDLRFCKSVACGGGTARTVDAVVLQDLTVAAYGLDCIPWIGKTTVHTQSSTVSDAKCNCGCKESNNEIEDVQCNHARNTMTTEPNTKIKDNNDGTKEIEDELIHNNVHESTNIIFNDKFKQSMYCFGGIDSCIRVLERGITVAGLENFVVSFFCFFFSKGNFCLLFLFNNTFHFPFVFYLLYTGSRYTHSS